MRQLVVAIRFTAFSMCDAAEEEAASGRGNRSICIFTRGSSTQVKLMAFCKGLTSAVFQQEVDRLLSDYIVRDLQSSSKVEKPSFIKLITGLQPSRHVPSRRQIQTQLNKVCNENICKLKIELSEIEAVCTRADCWTAMNKASWATRFTGSIKMIFLREGPQHLHVSVLKVHTHDVLAKVLSYLHKEFKIQNKIVCSD